MNTLLISLLRQPRDNKHLAQPLGISQIAASLYEEGFNVFGLDLSFLDCSYSKRDTEKIFCNIFREVTPEIIGVSLYDLSEKTRKYIEKIKKLTSSPVVVGGQVPTLFPQETLDTLKGIDIAIIGEGENICKDVWKTLETNNFNINESFESLCKIKGLILRTPDRKKKLTGISKRITNLDELPIPKRDIFPAYFINTGNSYEDQLITGSRSCSGHCIYCGSREYYLQMSNPDIAIVSDKRILDEVENIVNSYDRSTPFYLQFVDEDFFISHQKIEERLELLAKISSQYNGYIKAILLETRIDNFNAINRQKMIENVRKINMPIQLLVGVDHTRNDSLKFYARMCSRNHVLQGIDILSEMMNRNQNFEPYYSLIPYHPNISFDELKRFFEDLVILNDKIPFSSNNFLANLSKSIFPVRDTPFFRYLENENNLISDFEPILVEPYPWTTYTYEFKDNRVGMVANLSLYFSRGLEPTLNNRPRADHSLKNHELDLYKELNSKILSYYKKTLEFLSERDDLPKNLRAYDVSSLKKIQQYFIKKKSEISNFLQYKVDNGPTIFEIINSEGTIVSLDEKKNLITLGTT